MANGKNHTRSKNKGGRPTDYSEAVLALVATVPLPATILQICEHIKMDRSTVYAWMLKYPEFSDAITRRRGEADDVVVGSLYGRARGYTKEINEQKVDKDGCVHDLTKDVHVPADPNAALNWLKNRQPDDWRDKTVIEITSDHAERVDAICRKLGIE